MLKACGAPVLRRCSPARSRCASQRRGPPPPGARVTGVNGGFDDFRTVARRGGAFYAGADESACQVVLCGLVDPAVGPACGGSGGGAETVLFAEKSHCGGVYPESPLEQGIDRRAPERVCLRGTAPTQGPGTKISSRGHRGE